MTTARPQPRSSPPSALADGDPRPRLFTGHEYRVMKDSGIIAGGEPVELREGRILYRRDDNGPEWRRFTNAEYHAMDDAGVFAPGERVQSVVGEIVVMSPMGSRHAAGVTLINEAFYPSGQLSGRASTRSQLPVVVPDNSEPEPDLMLLVRRDDGYARAHPRPEDVLLLVEVADSTLAYDRRVKLPLYAAADIPESWLMNLQDDVIEAHTAPAPSGYRTVRRYHLGDAIAPITFPELLIPVSQLIPVRE